MTWLEFAGRRLLAGFCLYIVCSLDGGLAILATQEPGQRTACLAAMVTITLSFSEIVWRLIIHHPKTE